MKDSMSLLRKRKQGAKAAAVSLAKTVKTLPGTGDINKEAGPSKTQGESADHATAPVEGEDFTFVMAGSDVGNDLRAALAREQLDEMRVAPKMRDTLRKLWEDDGCRQFLRGKLVKFLAAETEWDTLLGEYAIADKDNKNCEKAVAEYLEARAQLTPGAARTVSSYVCHKVQLSRVTPFMRALGEFPRHIYHGVSLSPDLAPWMPKDLADFIGELQRKYETTTLGTALDVMDLVVVPLFQRLDKQWGNQGFFEVMGDEVKRPVWWSDARRYELSRLLAEARNIPACGGTASRPSRIWLSGPKQGKTHFMRVCALTLALLHPDALVGYCMYNGCQLTPQQIWQLHGPHVPQGEMPFGDFMKQLFSQSKDVTSFFFSDELEYLYQQRIRAPLEQLQHLGKSGIAVSVVTGTLAELPRMISSAYRLPEYVGLPDLNLNKYTPQCMPPTLTWAEAQDLAKAVARERWTDEVLQSREGHEKLKRLCWQFAGSLGAMVAHLQQSSDTSSFVTPDLEGDPFKPSNVIIGLVSRAAFVYCVSLGDAFALPTVTKDEAVAVLKRIGVAEPDRALIDLTNRCIIVEVQSNIFRLVHPVHVEWYRTQVMASGFTIGVVQEFLFSGRGGVLGQRAVIDGVAERVGVPVLRVALMDLSRGLQRLRTAKPCAADAQFEGSHMFGFEAEDGLEMSVSRGCVSPIVCQHQVKIHPGTKLIPSRQQEIVTKAARGLGKVLHALDAQMTDVQLHIWYYGEPVCQLESGLSSLYRKAFDSQLISLQNKSQSGKPLQKMIVVLHDANNVMDVLPLPVRTEIARTLAP